MINDLQRTIKPPVSEDLCGQAFQFQIERVHSAHLVQIL